MDQAWKENLSCVTHVLGQSSLKKMRGNERENTRGHRRTNEDDLQMQKWLEWQEADEEISEVWGKVLKAGDVGMMSKKME